MAIFADRVTEIAKKDVKTRKGPPFVRLIRLVRRLGTRDLIPELRPLLDDDGQVRMEVLKTLVRFQDPESADLLRKFLTLKNANDQLRVIGIAGMHRVEDLAQDLAAMVKTFSFFRSDYLRNEKIIEALGRIGHPSSIPVLERLAKTRFSFHPKLLSNLKLLLFQSLRPYETAPVVPLLRMGSLGRLDVRVDFGDVDPLESPLSEEQQEQIAALNTLCRARIEDIKEICDKIARQQVISAKGLGEVVDTFIRAFAHGVRPIRMLASLKSANEYTFTHVVNVCILTMSQAEAPGFRGDKLYEIGMASALHDAGKLLVPEEILTKPGRLTPEERCIMESHTVRGARYILGLEGVPKLSVLAALEHHLRFDGSGYPRIATDWKPNLVSQMLTISDVFDAMRSRRCYKEPAPLEEVLKVLVSEKGTTFNPFLIDNFLKLIKR